MVRKQVLVQFTPELLTAVDRYALREGQSRSEVVREAVARYVTDEVEAEISRQIIAGYRRVPPDDEFGSWADASLDEMFEETADDWSDLAPRPDPDRHTESHAE